MIMMGGCQTLKPRSVSYKLSYQFIIIAMTLIHGLLTVAIRWSWLAGRSVAAADWRSDSGFFLTKEITLLATASYISVHIYVGI